MTQISLIRPIEMSGQAADNRKTQTHSQAGEDEAASFQSHYSDAETEKTALTQEVQAEEIAPPSEDTPDAATEATLSDVDAEDAFPSILDADTVETESPQPKLETTVAPSDTAKLPDRVQLAPPENPADASPPKETAIAPVVSAAKDAIQTDLPSATMRQSASGDITAVKSMQASAPSEQPQAPLPASGGAASSMIGKNVAETVEPDSKTGLDIAAREIRDAPAPEIVGTKATQPRSQAAETVAALAQRLRTADTARAENNRDTPSAAEPQTVFKAKATPRTAPTAATLPTLSVAQAALARMQVTEKEQSRLLSTDSEPDMHAFDLKPGATQSHMVSQTARPAMPPSMMTQLVEIARAAQDKPVHVSLNPEELGRVRMSVTTAETGVTLLIVAEKPETLDLMRRNMDQIAREMANAGFTDLQLSFGEGQGSTTSENNDETPAGQRDGINIEVEDATAAATDEVVVQQSTVTHDGSLDLRL